MITTASTNGMASKEILLQYQSQLGITQVDEIKEVKQIKRNNICMPAQHQLFLLFPAGVIGANCSFGRVPAQVTQYADLDFQ